MNTRVYCAATAALCGTLLLPSSAFSFSYHDNEANLPVAQNYPVASGSFTVQDFKISKGQDPQGKIYKGLKVDMSGDKNKLTFTIGRHKTSEVALRSSIGSFRWPISGCC